MTFPGSRYFPALFLTLPLVAQTPPARAVTDPGVVTTRQAITPAGVPTVFTGKVYGVSFGASSDEVLVLGASHLWRMDWKQNKVVAQSALGGRPGLQGLVWDAARGEAVTSVVTKAGPVALRRHGAGGEREVVVGGGQMAGAPAVSAKGVVAVPLLYNNQLAVSDGGGVKLLPVGIAPFGVVLNAAGTVAYVSNWGGRLPKAGELTAPTGLEPKADQVVIDKRGVAATGTVTRLDLATGKTTHTIAVGLHPMAMAWDESRQRLYVANGNQDSISVIDTASQAVVATIELQPFHKRVRGVYPTAMALAGDGKRLWVACGGINAVLQVALPSGRIEGAIPTAWYPSAVALSADGKRLAVASLLGAGSGWQDEPKRRYVHAYRGTVAVVELPDAAQLASYTTAVAENSRLQPAGAAARAAEAAPRAVKATAIPERSGEPSLIEHVVYIIKENRTYDQLFGDLGKGNGDPTLVMFGEDVTPNQRRLAGQFVLLDNFYASGGNSADGHQWVTQANETAYTLYPGYTGRSYPYDGTDPLAYAQGGFIWDYALAKGRAVSVMGEFAPRFPGVKPEERVGLLREWEKGADFSGRWKVSSPIPPLDKLLVRDFPTYNTAIPDVARSRLFARELAGWEKAGRMPNLVLVQLPSDHTFGARPGTSTPKAMVADNDYAVGLMVEALSKSKFWPKMAIFVVEDDAQNGVDHVDGHRTVALAVSPYIRRGHVDSTFYSNQSMLKTIELILGLPTMSLFDLIANDMRASFQNEPDLTPYAAVRPKQDLYEVNPSVQALRAAGEKAAVEAARDSLKMRWEVPDAAPTERVNRILWGMLRGWDKPYPQVRNAVFAPLSLDVEDEEREEAEERR
ncbi:MAG: hypothetical protein J0L64_13360 [Acidobacteria bacterium]|nr:hypothetical protein [Acidobacteriota bacterium]